MQVRIPDPEARQMFLESVRESGRKYKELPDGSLEVEAADIDDLKAATASYEAWQQERIKKENQRPNAGSSGG